MIVIENNVCAVKGGEWRTFAVHAYQISHTKFSIREFYYSSLPFFFFLLLAFKQNFPATNSDDSRNLAMSSLHIPYCMAAQSKSPQCLTDGHCIEGFSFHFIFYNDHDISLQLFRSEAQFGWRMPACNITQQTLVAATTVTSYPQSTPSDSCCSCCIWKYVVALKTYGKRIISIIEID